MFWKAHSVCGMWRKPKKQNFMKQTVKEEFKGGKNSSLAPLFPFTVRRKWNVQKKAVGIRKILFPSIVQQIVLITRKISQAFPQPCGTPEPGTTCRIHLHPV